MNAKKPTKFLSTEDKHERESKYEAKRAKLTEDKEIEEKTVKLNSFVSK